MLRSLQDVPGLRVDDEDDRVVYAPSEFDDGSPHQNRYEPRHYADIRAVVVAGLLSEVEDISERGFMRLHAKCREIDRITAALRALGVDLLQGEDEDEGFFIAIRNHVEGCSYDVGSACHCKPFWRCRSCV